MLFELTNPEIAILMMSLFLFAVLLGFPIAFTLLAMGVGFGYYAYFDPSRMDHLLDNRIFSLLVQNTYTIMDNTVLTAVPLFLFMGYLVERAGIVAKLFFAIRLASHRLPASMAVAALVTCALFSTATGIIGAVVTLMGLLAWPAMIRAGYDKKFANFLSYPALIIAGQARRPIKVTTAPIIPVAVENKAQVTSAATAIDAGSR